MTLMQAADSLLASASEAGMDVQNALGDAWGKVTEWMEGLIQSLPNIIAALVVLLVFWGLARLARKVTRQVLNRIAHQSELNKLGATAAYVVVLGIGLVLALGVLNLDKTVTSLLAGAGIIGLALGFAFQDIAENFIAGIILNVRDQFHAGDIIESGDYMGVVQAVNLRATVIRTFPGQRVLIPNAQVFKNPIINYSQGGQRRVDIDVGIAYGDDLGEAKQIATQAVERLDFLDPNRDVELFYTEFGDSSINFQLRFWIDFRKQTDFLHARSEAIQSIKRAFDDGGITIPFPIRTLDFAGGVVGGQGLVEAAKEVGYSAGGDGQRLREG